MITSRVTPRQRVVAIASLILIVGAAGMGLFAAARTDNIGPLTQQPFSSFTSLPTSVVVVLLVGVAVVLIGRRTWWAGLGIFFLWLPFEDLVRKFAGNDIRVYLVKDVLLLLAIFSFGPFAAGRWRGALGSAWLPMVLVLVTAFIYSAPAALIDPRLPTIGIAVRFLFALLFPVGAYLAEDRGRLTRALLALSALSLIPCLIGVVQTIAGPKFLNPSVVDDVLSNIVVIKGSVIRPSGPFVDVGRFASMTTVSLVLGICLARLARTRFEYLLGVTTAVVAGVAAFASGGRTALILGILIAVVGVIARRENTRRRRFHLAVVPLVAIVGLMAMGTLGSRLGGLTSDRFDFYRETLSLSGSGAELVPRVRYYEAEAVKGIKAGGVTGQGTGTQTVGKQYLGEKAPELRAESGWGTVAVEWGLLGLAIWLLWVVTWTRRSIAAARLPLSTPAGPILQVISVFVVFIVVVLFSLGANEFDNYVTNAYFWLLSGVAFGSLRLVESQSDHESAETPLAEGHSLRTAIA